MGFNRVLEIRKLAAPRQTRGEISSMTPDQITALVATGESERLEFKSTTGTRREAASTMCAMLNQRGGHVLFGVTPEGDLVGQQVSERTIEEVSAEIQRIDPPAFPEIERVQVAGDREVIAVRVNQGSGAYNRKGKGRTLQPR